MEKVTINARNNSAGKKYIHQVKLNGKAYFPNSVSHQELLKGCVIDFDMSSKPDYVRGTQLKDFLIHFRTDLNNQRCLIRNR